MDATLLDGICSLEAAPKHMHPRHGTSICCEESNTRVYWTQYVAAEATLKHVQLGVPQGSYTQVYAATSPELEGQGGLYLDNCCPVVPTLPPEADTADWLWSKSEELLGL